MLFILPSIADITPSSYTNEPYTFDRPFSFYHPLALHHRRPRDLIRTSIPLRLTLGIIDTDCNTRMVRLVRSRKANRTSRLRALARNVNLRAALQQY
jgi:hypothetical protein